MRKEFLNLKIYEWIYLIFWMIFISILSFINNSSIYALISCLFGIVAVIFNMKGNRFAFIFYSLYALSYGVIAFINHNYGEGILNLFYNFPLYIFTIYKLFISKKEREINDKINTLSKKGLIIILIIIPFVTFVYGFILSNIENSNLPYVNALATGFAMISSFLTSRRIKEQWYFWILYSFTLIFIWLNSHGERIYLYLNSFYLISNSIGLYTWLKKDKENKAIENI